MKKRTLDYNTFSNIGYILAKLDDDQLEPIIKEVNKIKENFNKNDPFNDELAGNLKYEFELKDCKNHIADMLVPIINIYEERSNLLKTVFNDFSDIKDVNLKLTRVWVNFMSKHEFNPPHIHKGVYSFVLWLDTPYNIDDELKREESYRSTFNCPGHFIFQYASVLGSIMSQIIPVDKSWNGTLCVFPSRMTHSVMPFYTSDDYRISVSGNIERVY